MMRKKIILALSLAIPCASYPLTNKELGTLVMQQQKTIQELTATLNQLQKQLGKSPISLYQIRSLGDLKDWSLNNKKTIVLTASATLLAYLIYNASNEGNKTRNLIKRCFNKLQQLLKSYQQQNLQNQAALMNGIKSIQGQLGLTQTQLPHMTPAEAEPQEEQNEQTERSSWWQSTKDCAQSAWRRAQAFRLLITG